MAVSLQPAEEKGLMAAKRAERKREDERERRGVGERETEKRKEKMREKHKSEKRESQVAEGMSQLIRTIASYVSGLITPSSHL